jgi:hypothetical protein
MVKRLQGIVALLALLIGTLNASGSLAQRYSGEVDDGTFPGIWIVDGDTGRVRFCTMSWENDQSGEMTPVVVCGPFSGQ